MGDQQLDADLRRARQGDRAAAARLYDETVAAAWELGTLVLGPSGPVEEAVAAAYRDLLADVRVATWTSVRADLLARVRAHAHDLE